jgi:hypothetical protein
VLQKCFECALDVLHKRILVDVASPEVACRPPGIFPLTMKRRFSRFIFMLDSAVGNLSCRLKVVPTFVINSKQLCRLTFFLFEWG